MSNARRRFEDALADSLLTIALAAALAVAVPLLGLPLWILAAVAGLATWGVQNLVVADRQLAESLVARE